MVPRTAEYYGEPRRLCGRLSISCPRPSAGSYPLPRCSDRVIASFVRLINQLTRYTRSSCETAERIHEHKPRKVAISNPDCGEDGAKFGKVRSGRTCHACVVRDHVVHVCRPRFERFLDFKRTKYRMSVHIELMSTIMAIISRMRGGGTAASQVAHTISTVSHPAADSLIVLTALSPW